MQIDTGQLLTRRIYPQTGDFLFNPIVRSFSDWFQVGVSGDSEEFYIECKSGKVYDRFNKFCYYYKDKPLDIDIVFRQGTYNYRINDIILGAGQWDGYYWDTMFVKNFSSINQVEMDIFSYGDIPDLSYSVCETQDRITYTGDITNNSPHDTYLFTGLHSSLSTGINFIELPNVISGNSSGQYIFQIESGFFISGNYSEFSFFYDWGRDDEIISIFQLDESLPSGYINLSIDPNILHLDSGIGTIDTYWNKSYDLNISLDYVDGYGAIYEQMTGTGIGTGYYSGTILGSGYLESNTISGSIYYSSGDYSGYIPATGYGTLYSYATGIAEYDYVVAAVGYEGGNLSTGYIFGRVDGVVLDGSGYYDFYHEVTGVPSFSVWAGGVNLVPSGIYTGSLAQRYILESYNVTFGSGAMSPATGMGQVYEKTLANTWSLEVGSFIDSFENFLTNGWTSSYTYEHDFSGFSNGFNIIDVIVGYTGYYNTTDIAILTISNGSISGSVTISGKYD